MAGRLCAKDEKGAANGLGTDEIGGSGVDLEGEILLVGAKVVIVYALEKMSWWEMDAGRKSCGNLTYTSNALLVWGVAESRRVGSPEDEGQGRHVQGTYSKMRQRTETTDLRPIRPISEAREHQCPNIEKIF